jgi:CRP-like cAMP-binding protein
MQDFRDHLQQFVSLSQADWELLQSQLKEVTLQKGEYFLRQGQVNRRIGWVSAGICRYAYLTPQGEEHTKYFVREGQFVSAIESFTNQAPSADSIQALTDVRLYVLSYQAYQHLFEQSLVWPKLSQKLTEHSFAEKVKRLQPMVIQDAKSRYEAFVRNQPDVLRRVSLGYVASYLGMTQQSLSRLRRQLAQPV